MTFQTHQGAMHFATASHVIQRSPAQIWRQQAFSRQGKATGCELCNKVWAQFQTAFPLKVQSHTRFFSHTCEVMLRSCTTGSSAPGTTRLSQSRPGCCSGIGQRPAAALHLCSGGACCSGELAFRVVLITCKLAGEELQQKGSAGRAAVEKDKYCTDGTQDSTMLVDCCRKPPLYALCEC